MTYNNITKGIKLSSFLRMIWYRRTQDPSCDERRGLYGKLHETSLVMKRVTFLGIPHGVMMCEMHKLI